MGRWESTPIFELKKSIFSREFSKKYNIQVAEKIYFNSHYLDTIYKIIIDYPLLDKNEYKYSDLGFYLLRPIVNSLISGISFI